MVPRFADNMDPGSLAARMRGRRNRLFLGLLEPLPRPISILDVGGSDAVWRSLGLFGEPGVAITVLNLDIAPGQSQNVTTVAGDARDMSGIGDRSFDVVYSNSVIEHVGGPRDMVSMAREIRRVGRRYFVQTPDRAFPLEPHFVFPLFQFLPHEAQVALVQRFDLGWMGRHPDRREAQAVVSSVRLLSRRHLRACFPDATIVHERVAGWSKSLIAYRM